MKEEYKGKLNDRWLAEITLGQGDGNINIPTLKPCGNFKILLQALGDDEILIAQGGDLSLTVFKKELDGKPSNFYTLPLGRGYTINSTENGIEYISFLAFKGKEPNPVAVMMKIVRKGKKLIVTVIYK